MKPNVLKNHLLRCDVLENRNLLAACPGTNGETLTTPTLVFLDGTTTATDLTCTLGGNGWAANGVGDAIQITTVPVLHSDGGGQYQLGLRVEISSTADDDKCVFPEVLTKPVAIPTGYCLAPEECAVETALEADIDTLTQGAVSVAWTPVAAASTFTLTLNLPAFNPRWGDCTATCTSSTLGLNSYVNLQSTLPNFIEVTAVPTAVTSSVLPLPSPFEFNGGFIAEIANPCRDFDCMAPADQAQVLASFSTMAPFNR